MVGHALIAAGGLGLFMVGMIILTEGLRGLAGPSLRQVLRSWTATPVSGATTGAVSTAILQSSSATTVTAVGFVGAGVLTFPQALSVVFGANIGTTATGWIVALIGFKLELSAIAPGLLVVGVFMRLFGRGAAARIGWTMAGFALLFIGVDAIKSGLAEFQGAVTPEHFPDDTISGRLQLVFIGVLVTVITQSSSAGVAAALSALAVGAITLPQAAAMVIGMDVGTTATALIATLGGSTDMRRTGYAHVIYNLMTGVLAFLMLWPFAALLDSGLFGAPGTPLGAGDSGMILVAFHSFFNGIGVLAVLPFTARFAHLIETMVPETAGTVARRLDRRLTAEPAAALDTVGGILETLTRQALERLADALGRLPPGAGLDWNGEAFHSDVTAVREYLDDVHPDPDDTEAKQRFASALHAVDHLSRLGRRLEESRRFRTARQAPRLRRYARVVESTTMEALGPGGLPSCETRFNRLRRLIRRARDSYRIRTVLSAAEDRLDAEDAITQMDALRWLHRTSYHLWRISHHLKETQAARRNSQSRETADLT